MVAALTGLQKHPGWGFVVAELARIEEKAIEALVRQEDPDSTPMFAAEARVARRLRSYPQNRAESLARSLEDPE